MKNIPQSLTREHLKIDVFNSTGRKLNPMYIQRALSMIRQGKARKINNGIQLINK